MRYYGTINHWNKKRGIGTILIEGSTREIFASLKGFATLERIPSEGQHVSFSIAQDKHGREEAENICFAMDCLDCVPLIDPRPEHPVLRHTLIGLSIVVAVCCMLITPWIWIHTTPTPEDDALLKRPQTMVDEVAVKMAEERKAWNAEVRRSHQPDHEVRRKIWEEAAKK